jgi:PAS domain S-box-containing protein
VLAQRQQIAERERLNRMFQQAPGFRAMLEGPEHRFVLANPAYMQVVQHREVLGKTVAEALPEAVEQGYVTLLDRVFQSNEAFATAGARFEVSSAPGEPSCERFVDFVYQPVSDSEGRVTGIFVDGVDVTDRVINERRQAFRLALDERLRNLTGADAVLNAAVTMLGEHLGVNRVGYGQILPDGITGRLSHCFASGVAPLHGEYPLDSFGPGAIARQRRGEVEVCDDVEADPGQDPAVWSQIQTRAFVSVPLIREGRFVASLYVNSREPRSWSSEELALIKDVATRTRDAIERVKAEAALRESEERYRGIVEGAENFAIVTLDQVGTITSWNTGAEHIVGFRPHEAIGRPSAIFFTPEDRAAGIPEEEMKRAREDGRALDERWHLRANGERFWGSGLTMPLGDHGYLKIFRDSTGEHESEAAVKEAQAAAETLAAERTATLGQLVEGVILTDAEGRITFVNQSAQELHGTSQLHVPPERHAATYRLFTEDGRPHPSHELPLARAVAGETVKDAVGGSEGTTERRFWPSAVPGP